MASWVPSRDPGFANLQEWYAVTIVAGYAVGGYVLIFVLSMLGRWLVAATRKVMRYDMLYDYAEAVQSEAARRQFANAHLSQTVAFLSGIVSEATFEIRDVSLRDDRIELILASNEAMIPRPGQTLLVMDKRGGPPIGYLRVTGVTTNAIRATLEHAEPLWLGNIRNMLGQRLPFQTTAIAILTEFETPEEMP